MTTSKIAEGKKGEDLATEYLKKQGYKIIERNFKGRYGEIDIIALDHSTKPETLVFIEVKTRSSNQFGSPLEAITPWKLKAVTRTAEYYKLTHSNLPDRMRIDAVGIDLTKQNNQIELVNNISAF
jgi:putative endonuclease